jgi:protein-disulfide isomerase
MNTFVHRLLICCAGVVLIGHGAMAAEFSSKQKLELESFIREYLISHPEVIKEALEELERRQAAETTLKTKEAIKQKAKEIYHSSEDLVLGNPAGKVTVVEFFDYNCGYCKRALPEVAKLIETNDDVKVIIKEFPILGPGSMYAAKAALASRNQGKYREYHQALNASEGVKDETSVLKAAQEVGLDIEKLKKDMETDEVLNVIRRNYGLAEVLAINGTPSFVIDDTLEPGFVPFEELMKHVLAVRQNGGCKVC